MQKKGLRTLALLASVSCGWNQTVFSAQPDPMNTQSDVNRPVGGQTNNLGVAAPLTKKLARRNRGTLIPFEDTGLEKSLLPPNMPIFSKDPKKIPALNPGNSSDPFYTVGMPSNINMPVSNASSRRGIMDDSERTGKPHGDANQATRQARDANNRSKEGRYDLRDLTKPSNAQDVADKFWQQATHSRDSKNGVQ